MSMKRMVLFALAAYACSNAFADDQVSRIDGLFCNSEAQLDETLAHIGRNVSPQSAVELTNMRGVVCTYADKIELVINRPIDIGRVRGSAQLVKFKAMLVAVRVGSNLRAVTPPAEIFLVTPKRPESASVERGA
ncbi:MAG: hypothetical protein ABWY13_03555 [Mesorhizobium sp.]